MDPILLKAIREFVDKSGALTKSGVTFTPAQIEEFYRVKTEGKYGMEDAQKILGSIDSDVTGRNLARSAVQGATFNFGDELLGLVPEAMGGGEGAKEEMRLREDLFRKQHPVVDAVGNIAGGFAVPGLGLAKTIKVGTKGAAALGALFGAGAGAAAGMGSAEGDLKQRLPEAGKGAVAGAVIGAAAPTVIGGVKNVLSPAARAARRVLSAIQREGGQEAVQGSLAAAEAAGRGSQVTLGDLGPHLRQEADFVANNSDQALVDLAKIHGERMRNAPQRIISDIEQTGGFNDPEYLGSVVQKSQADWAASPEGFEGMRQRNPQLRPDAEGHLAELLGEPKLKGLWKEAQDIGLVGPYPDTGNPSFAQLQTVKQGLDNAVGQAFNRGATELGSRLSKARSELVFLMERLAPGYQELNGQYARYSKLHDALTDGVSTWDKEIQLSALARKIEGYTPEQRDMFRRGMAGALLKDLENAKTNRDAAKALLDASSSTEKKLELVFGGRQGFESFMEKMRVERELSKMAGPIGGSSTARRLQARGIDPVDIGLDIATQPMAPWSAMAQLTGALRHATKGAIERKTADEMAPWFTAQGPESIRRLLEQMGQKPRLGPIGTVAVPTALGGVMDQF